MERVVYFDNVKGILIVLVIVGHLITPIAIDPHMFAQRAAAFIWLFHMPLFVFVSGLFSKNVYRNGRLRAETIVFFLTLGLLLYTALSFECIFLGLDRAVNFVTLNGSLPWFLIALAAYYLCIPFFSAIKPAIALVGSVVIACIAGLFPEVGNAFTMSRILVFLPFFLLGYYMNPKSVEKCRGGLSARF